MWGAKFGFIVGSSLSFLFKHFGKVKGLFLNVLLVSGGLAAILAFLVGEKIKNSMVMIPMEGGSGFQMQMTGEGIGTLMGLLLFIAFIVLFLSMIRFSVGVIRAVVLDETASTDVVTSFFAARQMSYLWAVVKIMLMAFVVFLPFILFMIVTMGSAFLLSGMQGGGELGGAGLAGIGILGVFGYIATIIAVLVLFVRWSMAPVMAAIDKGTSLKESRMLTKGSWWLMALSWLVVGFVTNLMLIGFIFIAMLLVGAITFLVPTFGIALGVFVYVLALLLYMIPQGAMSGYIYLVLTKQVDFKAPEVTQKAS